MKQIEVKPIQVEPIHVSSVLVTSTSIESIYVSGENGETVNTRPRWVEVDRVIQTQYCQTNDQNENTGFLVTWYTVTYEDQNKNSSTYGNTETFNEEVVTQDTIACPLPEPEPPTPTGDYMYFQAKEINSTVGMMSTLPTPPNLEYSTDGETWQEWQHTTAEGTHTFDTITLGAIGDKVYFRGDNPDGLAQLTQGEGFKVSIFTRTGSVAAGGNIMSLLDKTEQLSEVPDYGLYALFASMSDEPDTTLITPPDMSSITSIGDGGCMFMYAGCASLTESAPMPALVSIGEVGCKNKYYGCTSLTAAADMPALTTIGTHGCEEMYLDCTFNMSDDGETLNFAFPTPPITAGDYTLSTAYDVADWMGNTNGFDGGGGEVFY